MITKSQPVRTLLPGFMLAACVVLPAGVAAQTAPTTTGTGALGAAMAEARRSPFHASGRAELFTIIGPVAVPRSHPGGPSPSDSTRGPSFHRVFWPTAGVTLLSYFLAGVTVLNCAYSEGTCDFGLVSTVALTAVAVAPPIAAKIAGGSFGKGFLGGVGGIAAGGLVVLLAEGFGMYVEEMLWVFPAGQAIFTTLASMR